VDPRILDLCREKPRFSYEAYEFVCDAVTFTQDRLGRAGTDSGSDDDEDRHVSAAELLRGVCDFAVQQFGLMAPVVFKRWGVCTTDDIGTMVFNLIKIQRLSKSDRDAPDDFHDLFDLHHALADGFELTLDEAQPVKRGER
jgi:uncharacterized repeat protein (TIGR04138 family)